MEVTAAIEIAGSKQRVWSAITDIENCATMMSNIIDIEVLHQPDAGLIGLKWKETRRMFGREASEIMWITDAREAEYYATRAESHGSIYVTTLSLQALGDDTRLTMSFSARAQSFAASLLSGLMGPVVKKSMVKEIRRDLEDIKRHVEQR